MGSKMTTRAFPVVIGVGEVLWDLLPAGKQLGGAPANFAYHAHALGAEALVVSRVGNDIPGREILDRLNGLGLRTDGITTDSSAPTGTVSVALDAEGQPTFTIHENVAWDSIEAAGGVLREAARADAICFGTLAQRHPVSRAAIRAVLGAAPPTALCIFDINLRQHFWSRELILESLQSADVLKLNDDELPTLARLLGLAGDESSLLKQLAERFGLKAVALTKGAKGSSLLADGELVHCPGTKIAVADTVGAGDSYTAALALGLLAGHEPERIIEFAHLVADYVCTQPGATPPMPAHLRHQFASQAGCETDMREREARLLVPKGTGANLVYTLPSIVERIELTGLFPTNQPLEVELGSGDASFLAEYARLHPDHNFIGVERLLGRMRKLDRKGRRAGLTNLRGVRIESSYFLEYLLPPGSATALHIYFPDPWPKRKHRRHRLINERFPVMARQALAPGGTVYLRTDDEDYFQQMIAVFESCNDFRPVDTPAELAGLHTDFEKDFQTRGISTLRAAYRLRSPG
jgi:fructokinase